MADNLVHTAHKAVSQQTVPAHVECLGEHWCLVVSSLGAKRIFDDLAPIGLVAGFLACGLVITVAGVMLTRRAETLARRTGLGEAMVGAALLGAITSLSGVVTSVTAALEGEAALSYSNAVGGIAAQTLFLAFADIAWRRANLEHSAASAVNLFQAALLLFLLSAVVLASSLAPVSLLAVHPLSLALPVMYGFALIASRDVRRMPLWIPRNTPETRTEPTSREGGEAGLAGLLLQIAGLALVVGVAGWVLTHLARAVMEETGLRGGLVGALITAVITSLPELVTTLTAVRRGALQLAVGGIIGGNTFDVLFLSAADIAYREGSLYHAVSFGEMAWVLLAMAMTALLLMGLIRREKRGVARIGFEGAGILILYFGGAVAIAASG